jgi:hypothetical protein
MPVPSTLVHRNLSKRSGVALLGEFKRARGAQVSRARLFQGDHLANLAGVQFHIFLKKNKLATDAL